MLDGIFNFTPADEKDIAYSWLNDNITRPLAVYASHKGTMSLDAVGRIWWLVYLEM